MTSGQFWGILPQGIEPHPSIVTLLEELEMAGWLPRKIVNARLIRYWPDQQRSRQIAVDLFHPLNEHKLDFYRDHTQLALVMSAQSIETEG